MPRCPSVLAVLALACSTNVPPASVGDASAPAFERAGPPTPRLSETAIDGLAELSATIDAHFERQGTGRVHVQLDRPLYRPGETVWVKTWSVRTAAFAPSGAPGVSYELLNPRGQIVGTKQVEQRQGTATNDFVLPSDAPGGRWTLRATDAAGEVDERPFIVASYAPPRILKELEFVREAYGPGDTVQALVELRKGTGEPLGDHPLRVLLQVDGRPVTETTLRTDASGAVLASGELPSELESGDGLLTVLVEEGGVTESISRSVPIVLADARFAFFPEGGDLVAELPGRVYFESTNRHGEPADVEGVIKDDEGREVTTFRSLHDGFGRFAFTPEPGRTYQAHVTVPPGIDAPFDLPAARDEGCVLRHYDDPSSQRADVRVGVRCTEDRTVIVTGVLRERALDTGAVDVRAGKESRVYLTPPAGRSAEAGAVRVTVFDEDRNPLAERLVYRNHGRTLQIGLETDQETYGPRDEVVLDVTTRDASGTPVPAEVAVSVVDDKVISFADDENGHILTRLYLEPELVDSPEDPAYYFDPEEADAPRAMDLLMGTRGYRRFAWEPVWAAPEADPVDLAVASGVGTMAGGVRSEAFAEWDREVAAPEAKRKRQPPPAPPQEAGLVASVALAGMPMAPVGGEPEPAPPVDDKPMALDDVAGDVILLEEKERPRQRQDRALGRAEMRVFGPVAVWSPVRVFPAPDYRGGFSGPRTDFRDTVHWAPTVTTGAKGTAQVRFYLSDAVTAFRITAEGIGGGEAGHAEATINSVLPVSVATRLPSAVSVGDRLDLPLTLSSTRTTPLDVTVEAAVEGTTLSLAGESRSELTLEAEGSATYFVPVEVGAGRETAKLTLSGTGGGLSDTVIRELSVVPAGFPQSWSAAGDDATAPQRFEIELTDVVEHSLSAVATWHPSPVSSLMSGMEGLIRTPGGCFEQTSSTNWPNVAILRYLEAHDGDPRLRMKSARALDVGYAKLTGYQVDAGGFETWGSGPGKEALSAFGLLQFADMAQVHEVAPAVLDRDVDYLLSVRDGQGGYTRTGESAHGYGSAPKPVLDGFIAFALVETGHAAKIAAELDHQATVAATSDDPYVLALAARALAKASRPEAVSALKRLAALQADDGSFPGAESSITRSHEANLLVESTALAALAMMEGGDRPGADRAVAWIVEHRNGSGTWGATQATALALGALTEHAELSRVPRSDGQVRVVVNGEPVETRAWRADATEPIELSDWASALRPGPNVIELVQLEGEPIPFSVDVSWKAVTPATAPGAELGLTTELAADRVGLGETVRLTTTVTNRLERIVPSPIARIGLPAGLEAQTWQLEELQERGEIAFFETRPREVTLYWDGIRPDETHTISLDLDAVVPGRFTAPASAAYPYYNDDEKAWSAGTTIAITAD